ncbi:MAG: hypothetical protein AAF267_04575, partial [Deinococcota bacterium]
MTSDTHLYQSLRQVVHSKVTYAFIILFLLVACSSSDDSDGIAPSVTLSADPEIIALGDSSVLTWDVTGDTPLNLSLAPDTEDDLVSPLTVTPTETTTYTLTARNDAVEGSDEVMVTVVTSPTIVDFDAAPITGSAPLEVSFSWNVVSPDVVSCTLTPDADGDAADVTSFDPCLGN